MTSRAFASKTSRPLQRDVAGDATGDDDKRAALGSWLRRANQGQWAEDKTVLKIRQLKQRLRPLTQHMVYSRRVDLSDAALLKWLIVSNFDVYMADTKIRKSLELREKLKIDYLTTEYRPPQHLQACYAGGLCGLDKQGSPVYYELYGLMNIQDVMKTVGREGLIQFKVYQHERILQHMKKLSRGKAHQVDAILIVADLQFCGVESLFSSALFLWAKVLEVLIETYPSLIKEILLINTHTVTLEIEGNLQSYFSAPACQLIKVCGRHYMPDLLKRIKHQEIPAYLGGNKKMPDIHTFARLDVDYWNCKDLDWISVTDARRAKQKTDECTVLPGIRRVEEYHVTEAESSLAWEVKDIDEAIGLSIYWHLLGERNLVFARCVLCEDSANLSGEIECSMTGRYLVVLDNVRDLAQACTFKHTITIRSPKEKTVQKTLKIEDTMGVKLPPIRQTGRKDRLDQMVNFRSDNTDWLTHI
ncbi:SEC14-like protein 3 [Physella acuta]|uniref:SEC14-like protein 3 n=1 Tax=Physella acuta TaxID=109671 RepID=UPI0027DD880B|nr:SEC14-like protein 3 [Physella acuta]XP_059164050.1 SEC14-like protein 3 [Physella acuta]